MASERELSQVPPDEFVVARNALARELRERGEAEEAKRVAALRRPSTPLWIVNQLGRRAPAAVEELIDATQRAGKAQVHAGARDQLRDAMHAQRQALQKLLGEAEKTAAGIGARITPEIQRRIHDTLQTAATADPNALRNGTLAEELSAAGFGALLTGAAPTAQHLHANAAAAGAKAAAQRSAFHEHAAAQKQRLAEKRDHLLREREIQHAQQAARRLAGRAEQFERVAARAGEAAEKAQARAEQARIAANEAASRLLGLRR